MNAVEPFATNRTYTDTLHDISKRAYQLLADLHALAATMPEYAGDSASRRDHREVRDEARSLVSQAEQAVWNLYEDAAWRELAVIETACPTCTEDY